MYAIEKNVPVPTTDSRGRPNLYPWGQMQVGDSFAVPISAENKVAMRRRLWAGARRYGKANGIKFTVRTLPGLLRVWRTK